MEGLRVNEVVSSPCFLNQTKMAKQNKIEAEDAIIIAPEVPQLKTGQQIITKPGIYQISVEDYHADKKWISSTGVRHCKSMSEYRLYLDGYWDNDEKAHFDYGNAIELYLIDKEEFKEKVAIAPDHKWIEYAMAESPKLKSPRASKVFKDLQEAFNKANEGKYIIPEYGEQSLTSIQVQAARVMADKWMSLLLDGIDYQSSCYWIDKETGLQMKCRPDVVNHKLNTVINIKTILDASPESFSKALVNHEYPLQACIEIEGVLESGLLKKVDKYFWLVLEKEAPFNVQLYEFDHADLLVLRDEYHYNLRRIKKAMDTDHYPGYNEFADNELGVLTAKIPQWYKMNSNR
jgi:exodeoxyribonuclease VIII